MKALKAGVEIRVHLHPVGVELQLGGIQQGLVGGEAGHHIIHGLNEVDDVGHGPVGHGGGNVAGHGVRQSGADVGLGQLLLPGAFAVQNVTEALHQDLAVGQHVGQLAHLLGVGNGLVEGHGEVVGAENGQVGVVALLLLVGVAVDHRQVVVIVFLTDKAAGVLAEGADLILEGPGITHQLGLVQDPVYGLHDLIADLHTDTDIHSAGGVSDVVFRAELFQPVGTPAAGSDHGVLGVDLHVHLAVGHGNALADVIFQNQVAALVAEVHLYAVLL